MNVFHRRASPTQGTVQYGSPQQAYTSLLSHVHSCCCEREVFPAQITFCRMCSSFAPSWFDGKYQWVQLLLLWFQNLIIRRRKQQNQCRPLQIGSIFLSRRSLFLKRKTFFGWCNVKSDLSVTIINQKGKLIWAERRIKKNKIITNLCFMRWMSNKARNNLLILLSSQKTDFDCSNLLIIHNIRKFWKLLLSIS